MTSSSLLSSPLSSGSSSSDSWSVETDLLSESIHKVISTVFPHTLPPHLKQPWDLVFFVLFVSPSKSNSNFGSRKLIDSQVKNRNFGRGFRGAVFLS